MALRISTLFKLVVGFVVVLVIAAGSFAAFFDPNDYKDRIVDEIEARTGRGAVIDGSLEWSFYPWLGLRAGGFSIGNRQGFEPKEFLSVKQAGLSVALMPLLRGDLIVDKISLDGGRFNLQRDASGKDNWSDLIERFSSEGSTDSASSSTAEKTTAPTKMLIHSVDITESTLAFSDAQAGKSHQLTVVRAKSGNISSTSRVPVDLQIRVGGTDVPESMISLNGTLSADLENQIYALPDMVMRAAPAANAEQAVVIKGNLSLDFANQLVSLSSFNLQGPANSAMSGKLAVKGFDALPVINGEIDIASLSVPQLLSSFGISNPLDASKKPLETVRGQVTFSGDQNSLNVAPLEITFDESRLTGWLKLSSFAPLTAKFDLNIDQLLLDRYLPPDEQSASTGGNGGASAVPLQPMRKLNLNGNIAIGGLKAFGLSMSGFQAAVKAGGGKITLSPMSAGLYGGSYNGNVVLDANGKALAWSANEKLTGVSAGPLSKDMFGSDRIDGKATITAKLSGWGTSEKQILSSVSGNSSFSFSNGSFKGFNLAQALREVDAKLKGKTVDTSGPRETDFSELTGTATIKKGVVTNKDLAAKSPYFRLSGSGNVNLPASSMNYLLNVKVVESYKGQGGEEFSDLEGLTIPIRIKGPFNNLKYYPDLEELFKARAKQELEKQQDKLEEKARQAIEEKLFGKKAEPQPEAPSSGETQTVQQPEAPASGETQSAPQTKPQQEKSPEDQLKDELKKKLFKGLGF